MNRGGGVMEEENGKAMDDPGRPVFRDITKMGEDEKKEEARLLAARLKELRATPRSDWHREFERILRIEAEPYGGDVQITAEHTLGVDPPRADFLILDDRKRMMRESGKGIFQIFREHNIVEYKNPNDVLDGRTLRKTCGYANLYISAAGHAGDVPEGGVSVSVFRAVKPRALFSKLEGDGMLEPSGTPGVYKVKGMTDLPFQIVITDELEGGEYAAYRALSDHAAEQDMEALVRAGQEARKAEVRERYLELLRFLAWKNPEAAERLTGGGKEMSDILMDLLKPRIEQEKREYARIQVDKMKAEMNAFLKEKESGWLEEKNSLLEEKAELLRKLAEMQKSGGAVTA